jgi:hypothetical protein
MLFFVPNPTIPEQKSLSSFQAFGDPNQLSIDLP